jgi:hypothetical protein
MSDLERLFAIHVQEADIPQPKREYSFCHGRRWRFDFAWPRQRIAVEIEGGVWSGGRHTRGKGFIADCEKYNTATYLGWRVFRFPGSEVEDGSAIAFMVHVFDGESP